METDSRQKPEGRKHRLIRWIREECPLVSGGVLAGLVLLIAAVLFFKTPTAIAKRFDILYGFQWIAATAVIGLIGLAINGKSLIVAIRKRPLPLPAIGTVLLITLFAGVVAVQWISLQHRVLSDETSWEGMALQMYYNKSGGVCNQGIFTPEGLECLDEVNNFKGKAMALAEWLAYAVSEPGRDAALRVNLPLFLLSLPLLFGVVFHSTGRRWLAVTATAALATLPTMLFQSRAASTEVLYIFLLLVIVRSMQLLATEGFRGRHLVWLLPVMGIFAQTRQETIFAFAAFAWYWLPWFRQKIWHLPVWIIAALAASFPMLATICGYKGYNFQGGEYAPHSLHNLAVNFWDNAIIMLGLKKEPSGLLTYPFLTVQTVLLFVGLITVVVLATNTGKYRRQLWMGLLFFIQPIVIMVNVSGNFTIDINQRYILTMFPAFAILTAIGWHEWGERIAGKRLRHSAPILSLLFIALGVGLILSHKADFVGNTMYRKNKLLEEEAYLHSLIRDQTLFADSSLFVYARPWQMIVSGRSSISETRMLNWSPDEFLRWQEKTGNNIYLVRGQDGYGTVNRKSRVVGFKTTEQMDQLLERYEVREVNREIHPFGYPLITWQLTGLKGQREWIRALSAEPVSQIVRSGVPEIRLRWDPADSLSLETEEIWSGERLPARLLTPSDSVVALPHREVGPHLYRLRFSRSDGDTATLYRDFWLEGGNARLLSSLTPSFVHTEWGSLRINRSVDNNPMKVAGIPFTWGMGIHADSRLEFELNGRYSSFRFITALDDESLCGDGARFEVIGDGKTLFTSRSLYGLEWEKGEVSVAGVQKLLLKTVQQENNMCDHTGWFHPWIE